MFVPSTCVCVGSRRSPLSWRRSRILTGREVDMKVRVGIALVATLVVVGWTSPAASAATSTVEHDVVVTQPTCAQEPYCGDLDAWSGTYNGYGFWEWSLNNP